MKEFNNHNLFVFRPMFIVKRVLIVLILILSIYLIFKTESFKTTTIDITSSKQTIRLNVELAISLQQQQQGLMNRKRLEDSKGMLFIFPNSSIQSFWMKDTYISLDIIFLSENGDFINASTNTPPCLNKGTNCPSYISTAPAKYVLEVNSGWLEKYDNGNGLKLDTSQITYFTK